MQTGDTLNSAYILESRAGKNAFGETWFAQAGEGCINAASGTELVLKILSLGDMPDWKGFELFEREAAALRAMSRPGIPRYVDSFRMEKDDAQYLVLVMERVPGISLASEVENGKRFTEAQIEEMLANLLDIVSYLHALRPPIIHRDINPKNIIRKPDGGLALVDFSGVQDAVRLAYRDTSTMIGTAGYAPIEQVSGRASVRSDLYAIAATAAFLLTRRHPSDLPLKDMSPDPGALVELSPALAAVLGNYLQADEAKRTLPVADAVAILRGSMQPGPSATGAQKEPARAAEQGEEGRATDRLSESMQNLPRFLREGPIADALGQLAEKLGEGTGSAADSEQMPIPVFGEARPGRHEAAAPATLPSDSKVKVTSDQSIFTVDIPRLGFKGGFSTVFGLVFAASWLGFVAFWTFLSVSMGAPVFFSLFSLPFWAAGIFMVRMLVKPVFSAVSISMSEESGFTLSETFIGKPKTRSYPLSDIGLCSVQRSNVSQNGRYEMDIAIEAGTKTLRFGRALSDREKRAIMGLVNAWLKEHRRASGS